MNTVPILRSKVAGVYRVSAIFFVLIALCSGTALAGFGGESPAATGANASLPSLEATTTATTATAQVGAAAQLGAVAPTSDVSAPEALAMTEAPSSGERMSLTTFSATPSSQFYYGGSYLGLSRLVLSRSAPALWVETSAGWAWSALCPQGSWTRMLIYVPRSGNLIIYEIYPTGTTQSTSLGRVYSGYRTIPFYGDMVGRHYSFVALDDVPSNAVLVDVISAPPRPAGGIPVGTQFSVSLSESPTTGYRWEVEYDNRIIRKVGDKFVQSSTGIGSSFGGSSDIQISVSSNVQLDGDSINVVGGSV
ncbi:MAG: protease inhibitor I42 family protein [Methanotrichaceae archaeon]|nr:protease inhibitor I42 family protein [Methanotrichaceae archaeon]